MDLFESLLLLGSSLGNKDENINSAIEAINSEGIEVMVKSSRYLTSPWGEVSHNTFLNQAIIIKTTKNPFDLLSTIKDIEVRLGRQETEKWGDRIIDIDILLYQNFIIDSDFLKIPHPQLQNRKFSLIPSAEIAADWKHPLYHRTMKELLEICEDNGNVSKQS